MKPVVGELCETPGCGKPAKLLCQKCIKLSITCSFCREQEPGSTQMCCSDHAGEFLLPGESNSIIESTSSQAECDNNESTLNYQSHESETRSTTTAQSFLNVRCKTDESISSLGEDCQHDESSEKLNEALLENSLHSEPTDTCTSHFEQSASLLEEHCQNDESSEDMNEALQEYSLQSEAVVKQHNSQQIYTQEDYQNEEENESELLIEDTIQSKEAAKQDKQKNGTLNKPESTLVPFSNHSVEFVIKSESNPIDEPSPSVEVELNDQSTLNYQPHISEGIRQGNTKLDSTPMSGLAHAREFVVEPESCAIDESSAAHEEESKNLKLKKMLHDFEKLEEADRKQFYHQMSATKDFIDRVGQQNQVIHVNPVLDWRMPSGIGGALERMDVGVVQDSGFALTADRSGSVANENKSETHLFGEKLDNIHTILSNISVNERSCSADENGQISGAISALGEQLQESISDVMSAISQSNQVHGERRNNVRSKSRLSSSPRNFRLEMDERDTMASSFSRQETGSAISDLERVKRNIGGIQQNINDFQDVVRTIEAERDQSRAELVKLMNVLKQKNAEISRHVQQHEKNLSVHQESEAAYNFEMSTIKKEQLVLYEEYREMCDKLKKKDIELFNKTKQMTHLTAEFRAKEDELHQKNLSLHQKLEESEEEKRRLKEELSDTSKESALVKGRLKYGEQQYESLHKRLTCIMAQLIDAKQRGLYE